MFLNSVLTFYSLNKTKNISRDALTGQSKINTLLHLSFVTDTINDNVYSSSFVFWILKTDFLVCVILFRVRAG